MVLERVDSCDKIALLSEIREWTCLSLSKVQGNDASFISREKIITEHFENARVY